MHYLEKPPSPPLQRYLEAFWQIEAPPSFANPAQEKILPDGCTEIIFNLADRFQRFHADGTIEQQPRVLVVGQMRQHVTIAPTGSVQLFGIRFKPGGAFPFLRMPLHELTDQILGATEMWRDFSNELEERLHHARSFKERVRFAESALTQRLQLEGDRAVELLVERIIATAGCRSVAHLARDIGLSKRQLERRFQISVGLSPKLLARIIRFQRVFKAIEENPHGWSNVALACGYYDQAHLIHDFKAFSGQNPSAFLLEQTQMSAHLTRKHRTSFFYKTKN
ncbi:helix-turn-helix transcriptional regulator [candidate division KSB1 bacterium]|nr:helix-turn-helix transcriptional regulator [candidate division KSB1 bacterium]